MYACANGNVSNVEYILWVYTRLAIAKAFKKQYLTWFETVKSALFENNPFKSTDELLEERGLIL